MINLNIQLTHPEFEFIKKCHGDNPCLKGKGETLGFLELKKEDVPNFEMKLIIDGYIKCSGSNVNGTGVNYYSGTETGKALLKLLDNFSIS